MGNITIPAEVTQQIKALALRLRTARKRREWPVAEAAAKAGINRNTLSALESGKPGVSIGAYVTVLWTLGLNRSLDAVARPEEDQHGKALEAARRPTRIRRQTPVKDEYDF